MVRGTRWECRYCGDFEAISSLQHSEKAKLMHADVPSIKLTVKVTASSDEEDSPRSFSRAELEDMVRRWNLYGDEGHARICWWLPFMKW